MGVTKGKSATSLSLKLQTEAEFSFFLVAASPHWDFETWDDSGAVLVPGRGHESHEGPMREGPGPPLPLTAFWYVLKLAWDQPGAGSKGTALLEETSCNAHIGFALVEQIHLWGCSVQLFFAMMMVHKGCSVWGWSPCAGRACRSQTHVPYCSQRRLISWCWLPSGICFA